MADAWLECASCGNRTDLGPSFRGCARCRAIGRAEPLEVRYAASPRPIPPPDRAAGLWRWARWLPPFATLTLGEGDTPLIPLDLGEPGPRLWLKNETMNPTWSWKDRPNAVTVAAARHYGFARVAAISTGNHGSSQAAYAARAGLACTIFRHPDAPEMQGALMALYGSEVRVGYDAEAEAALGRLLDRGDTFPGTTLSARPGFSNPYGVEGFKTIAFEVVEQLGGTSPDRVYVATGSGDGTYGIWKGFREMRDAGVIPRTPRIVACQAEGADSLRRAFVRGLHSVEPLDAVDTRALSIAELRTGDQALRAAFESGGTVTSTSDLEAFDAAVVAARQGIAIELASSVPLACALAERRGRDEGESWVVIGSGAAVKWPGRPPLAMIDPTK